MRWLTRYRLRAYARRSAWLAPTAAIPAALLVSPVIRRIDDWTRWDGLGYTPDAARAVLGAMAPATLTFIVLILSTLLLAIQLASSQLSPRLIGGLLSRRPVKICLAIFVFSYVYCAAALGRVEQRVPQLCVAIALGLTLVSVGGALFLIDYLAKELRPVQMLARTAALGRVVIEQTYPILFAGAESSATPPQRPELPAPVQTIVKTARSGILLAMDVEGLASLAKAAGAAVEVVPQVGDFVARGDALFRVHSSNGAINPARLNALLAFGDERTAEQDPTFVFRILVDVACKALSPAINDPTTAVLSLDQIHHLLRQVGMRRLDTGQIRDADGYLRLLYRPAGWDDFVLLAVTEIRQYGAGSIQMARRLHAMLENLNSVLPEERRSVLGEQLRLLHSAVARSFDDPEDRVCAEISDLQGVGGSANGESSPRV